jgi:hypothetical protein
VTRSLIAGRPWEMGRWGGGGGARACRVVDGEVSSAQRRQRTAAGLGSHRPPLAPTRPSAPPRSRRPQAHATCDVEYSTLRARRVPLLCAYGRPPRVRRCCLLSHPATTMNLSLVDPFVLAQDCPEVITGRLREYLRPRTAHAAAVTHSTQAAAIRRRSASATAATCSPLAV